MRRTRKAPEDAPDNLKRVWFALHPSPPETDVWLGLCAYRNKRARCVLPLHHSNLHRYVTASHYQFMRAGGELPDKTWILVPLNGDWDDLTFENWEPISRQEYWQRRFRRPHVRQARGWVQRGGVWQKECTECGKTVPVEYFPPKRNQCRDCWPKINRERVRKSYDDHTEAGCVVVSHLGERRHYHLGQLGAATEESMAAAKKLGVARYYLEPSPSKRRKRAAEPGKT